MTTIDEVLKPLIANAQQYSKEKRYEELKNVNGEIIELLKKFRYGLGRKFGNRGVEFNEIIQTIDLILLQAIQDYDNKKDKSPFRHLISKTKNGIWNYYRKEMNYFNKSKNKVSYDEILEYEYNFVNISETEFKIADNLLVDGLALRQAIQKIRPKQRLVLEKYFFEDKNTYEIGEELGINQSNVFRRLERGLASLKEFLQED